MVPHSINKIEKPTVAYATDRILIVDNEESNIILLQFYLKNLGKEVIVARSGREAIKICKEVSDIHLILMDIGMPMLDGIETTKRIQAFNDVPVIAISAYPLILMQSRITDVRFEDYLEKPYSLEDLFQRIKKYLNHVNKD